MKMTEREFERRLGDLLMSRSPAVTTASLAKEVAQVAREAGLEFAPEPAVLPDSLEWRDPELSDHAGAIVGGNLFILKLPPILSCQPTYSRIVAICKSAVARFNAYPGLRKAVEREVEQILHHYACLYPYRKDALPLIVERLRAELARGPEVTGEVVCPVCAGEGQLAHQEKGGCLCCRGAGTITQGHLSRLTKIKADLAARGLK